MSRPHIVHVIGTPNPGGVQVNLLSLIRSEALGQFRHSVICLISDQGWLRPDLEAAGVEVHFCPLRWPHGKWSPSYRLDQFLRDHFSFTFPWRLATLLKKMNASLAHTHISTRVGLQAGAVLEQARLPWIWTVHGLYRSRGEDTSEWGRAARLVNRSNAMVTAVCRSAMQELTSHEMLLPAKQALVFNGIELDRFSSGGKRLETRTRLNVPRDALVFGTAGRLMQIKRHDLLIEAAARLIRSGVDAYFLLAGEGPMLDSMQGLISDLDVGERVRLVGHQKEMPAFLSALDVFVLCSDSEALPLALMEACAAGLPCIATQVGGVTEILGAGQGLLVSPNSAQALAEAMQAMTSAAAREQFARNAAVAAEKFSHEKVAADYAALYGKLIGLR